VEAVADVVLDVFEIDERGLAEIVVRKIAVPVSAATIACEAALSDESRTVSGS
jgi:hypothetical protein